jgi:hypothetical protein
MIRCPAYQKRSKILSKILEREMSDDEVDAMIDNFIGSEIFDGSYSASRIVEEAKGEGRDLAEYLRYYGKASNYIKDIESVDFDKMATDVRAAAEREAKG